ncbi:MAG: hypothetical protein ACRDGL_01320 [Candidatus Limnocylindrales bacterium]
MKEPARHRPAVLGGRTRDGGGSLAGAWPGGRSLSTWALLVSFVLSLAACGGSTPSASPTPRPATASPTIDPRLPDPTTADAVYVALNAAGLGIVGTNAEAGPDPVKLINATYAGQPLVIVGYSTDAARIRLAKLSDGSIPGRGDPPYTFAALNIVLEFGAGVSGSAPPKPDVAELAAAQTLAAALDRLIGPLTERSGQRVSPRPSPTPSPVPRSTPSSTPSATPAATRASSPRPSPTP